MNRWNVAILLLAGTLLGGRAGADDPPPPVPVRAVAFSPDGNRLAVGFGSKEVAGGLLLWDIQAQSPERVIRHKVGVSSLAFSPDGERLAFTQYDRAPQILEVASGSVVATLPENYRGPVAFSPDGRSLASGRDDKAIPLWDLKREIERQALSGPQDRVYGDLAYSPDGSLLVTPCGSDGIHVWDLAAGQSRHVLRHGRYFVRSALFSPDGKTIISGGFDGTVRTWDSNSGEELARFSRLGGVDGMDYSPANNVLAVCSTGSEVRLLALNFSEFNQEELSRIRELLEVFEDDRYEVREAASADLVKLGFRAAAELQRAAAESPFAEVRIRARRAREAIMSEPLAVLRGHQGRVWSAAFSPDGELLATASDDGTVRLWDVAARKETSTITPAVLEASR